MHGAAIAESVIQRTFSGVNSAQRTTLEMENPVSLTPAERLILVNQYDILEKLYPERAEECDLKREILEMGVTARYAEVFGEIAEV